MQRNYFETTSESQNFIDYFSAVNPTFLNSNVKALYLVKTDHKVYLKTVFQQEEYLNRLTFVTAFVNLDMVVGDCDSDENPEGRVFEYSLSYEELMDHLVNLGEDCLIQLFDKEFISIPFILEHYGIEAF